VARERVDLETAGERGLLKRFAKEHPSECDADRFKRLLEAMAKPKSSSKDDQT
jgi:hypothetical protein